MVLYYSESRFGSSKPDRSLKINSDSDFDSIAAASRIEMNEKQIVWNEIEFKNWKNVSETYLRIEQLNQTLILTNKHWLVYEK